MHIAVASAGLMDRTRMAFGAEKKKTRYGETGRLIGSHAGINVDYQIKELCRSVFFFISSLASERTLSRRGAHRKRFFA